MGSNQIQDSLWLPLMASRYPQPSRQIPFAPSLDVDERQSILYMVDVNWTCFNTSMTGGTSPN